ncbi:MAG: ankyrin repeat domain-containing protein, partial [Fusobacterium periodonticum]|nr:ankyrin repeat domain-containing protein [Fusobacterium periodonticum]
MIKLKDIGSFKSIPEILDDIIKENISKLDEHLAKDWDINKNISISKYTDLSPLDYALIMEAFESVKWLVEHGANLNAKDRPSFLTAVRYCDEKIIQYLVSHGA